MPGTLCTASRGAAREQAVRARAARLAGQLRRVRRRVDLARREVRHLTLERLLYYTVSSGH